MSSSRAAILIRILFYVISALYLVWAVHKVWVDPSARTRFFFLLTSTFFFLYLLPITLFQAKLEPKPNGLNVLQYGSVVLPYRDIKHCIGLFLVPFPIVIVISSRRFPLKVLISADEFEGRPRGLIQDGRLAKSIKAMWTEGIDPSHGTS
jgi:hypothetical protein